MINIVKTPKPVIAAIDAAKAGDIFVPRAPSATVIDIAKSLIGAREINIEIIGIRPAEKMHEIMISEEEAPYVQEQGDYYSIGSMLPELHDLKPESSPLEGEFSSENSTVGLEATTQLLEKHSLLLEQAQEANDHQELLR